MRRIKLIVSYDGTNYSGFQIQPNAVTIEEELNKALSDLCGEEVKVIGASRTDAGVHALMNVAVFDTDMRMAADKFAYALNQRLPSDIIIQDSCEVPEDFHPRYASSIKTYEYRILNRKFPDPLLKNFTYQYYYELDVPAMNEAAGYFIGEHDFTSFSAVKAQVNTRVRTIYECSVTRNGDLITLRIRGNGFLYNMVRIIAGTLLKVGSHDLMPSDIPAILEFKNREAAGPTAPPQGLVLISIEYTGEENRK